MNGKRLKAKLCLSPCSNIICLGHVLETFKSIINHAQWKQAVDTQSKEITLLPQTATIIIYQRGEFCLSKSWCRGKTILVDYPAKNCEISLLCALLLPRCKTYVSVRRLRHLELSSQLHHQLKETFYIIQNRPRDSLKVWLMYSHIHYSTQLTFSHKPNIESHSWYFLCRQIDDIKCFHFYLKCFVDVIS